MKQLSTRTRWSEVRGAAAILAWHPALQQLADKTNQGKLLDALDYSLNAPYFDQSVPGSFRIALKFVPKHLLTRRTRHPVLLIRLRGNVLEAAVLLFYYSMYGLRTRCYIPMDEDGYRTVIASEHCRESIALEAGEYLLTRGAFLALVSAAFAVTPQAQALVHGKRVIATQIREVGRTLPFADTLQATLETLSRNTRHNYKRARQQIVRDYAPVYVGCAEPSAGELVELNESCTFAVPQWVAQQRLHLSRSLSSGVVAGLKDQSGRWISLVGGHREGDMLCLDWQMNRSGLGNISVATAMRSFLIEHEIARGTCHLRFERGTTHPICNAFRKETTYDWVFAKGVLGRALTGSFARGARGGPLANVLSSPSLVWRTRN